jgi:hypothetical protein
VRLALAIVAVIAASQMRADVVVMRDGSQRSGSIEICDQEGCRLSGTRIPAGEIRAIYFGAAKPGSLPRAAGILLRDGSLRKGRVSFVNRGVVDLDDEEIDRDRVAAVIFIPEEDPPADLLILRNGTVRTGSITSCNAASCTLDGSLTPLADIEWAGFARDDVTPPPTGGSDEVHKTDGTIVPARLTALSATSLSTTRGPVARAETAWVHVALPTAPQQPQPGAFGAPQSPPTAPPAPTSSPQPPAPHSSGSPPAPGPQPAPPSGDSPRGWPPPRPRHDAPPRLGGLWTGTVIARYRANDSGILYRWDIDARVRLREKTAPLLFGTGAAMRSVGSFSWLVPEGSVLTEKVTCQGDVTCEGEGTITVSGEENINCSGFWWKNEDVDISGPYQIDIPRTGMYSVCLGAPQSAMFTITYRAPGGVPTSYESSYVSPVIGRHPLLERAHFMDPDTRTFPGGAAQMTGSYFKPANADFGSLSVSWSICRETQNCPPPGPLPPDPEDPDDCPPPASQQALLERALAELRAKVERAGELEAEYKRIEQQARQWEGDYMDVMWDCRLFSLAKTLTGFLLGNFAPKVPPRMLTVPTGPGATRIDTLPGIEAGKTFVNFVNFIEKISDGDASWLIPDTEFGPGGQEWVSAEDIWDGVTVGWNALQSQGATPAQMREAMLSCGSPSIAAAKEGALQYLRLLEELRPLGDEMNTVKNDIRNLETNQIEGDLWPKYQRECLRYEQCREGGDPSRCNQLPRNSSEAAP